MKILNYLLLFTLFYGCVAGDVGGDKTAKGAASSSGASAPLNPSLTSVSPSTTLPLTTSSDLSVTSLPFTSSVYNPNSIGFVSTWYQDTNGDGDFLDASETLGPFSNTVPSLNLNPSTLGVGTYNIYLEISDGLGTVYDSKTWNLDVTSPSFTGFSVASSPSTINTFHALNATSYALNGFTMNGTNDSRGTLMTVTGFAGGQDFCLQQTGVGPGLASDYKVVFLDSADSPLSPALPVGIPFSGLASEACLFSYSTAISFAGAPTTNKVKAVVYNTSFGSNPEVTRQEWDINVEALNTAPTISIDTGSSTALASIVQGGAANFAITVEDKDQSSANAADFAINYTINSSPVDGASNMPLDSTTVTPDCTRALGDATAGKYTCAITFNYFGDAGSINPAAVYTVQVTATDSTALTSSTLTWLVTPTEVTTAPTFQNVLTGVAVANPLTNSYIYDTGDNTASIAAANEGDTLAFQVSISEPERDDYTITWEYYDAVAGAYQTAAASTVVTRSTATDPVATTSASFTVPESAVTGAASASVNFRVTVTDAPDTLGASSVSQIFPLTITNVNPAPILTGGAASPALTSVNYVSEGTGISLSHSGAFSDASTADGDTIVYQWQSDVACDGTYANISGATSASINWSPNVGSGGLTDGAVVCLRLCYGDNGFGNPADCTGGVVGPWVGGASNFVTVRESDQLAIASTNTKHATWMDGLDQYIVTSSTNQITVTQNQYNATTGAYTTGVDTVTFNSDTTSNASEVPLDLSIVGDATSIWVAYRIEEADFFVTPTSVMRVRRIDRATLATIDSFDINEVTAKIGRITTNGTNWYLPYIDFNNSDYISFKYAAIGTAGGATTSATSIVTTAASDLYSAYDSDSAHIVLVIKDLILGTHHMYSIDPSGGAPVQSASVSTIFAGATVSRVDVSGARTGNGFNYVAATNTSNQLVLYRNTASTLASGFLQNPVNTLTPSINTISALTVQTGVDGANHEVYIGTVVSNNAYLTRSGDTGQKSSRVLNQTASSITASTGDDLTLFIQENFVSGTGDDNTNDTIFSTFSNGTNVRSVPVNIEDSSFSEATPFFQ
ncbi:hypothetical protein [Halobacteriovorax sp. HLS]|uniref:hypothetical protein n=1 Tax=Halobacteriovorax sp. HLS TaxID=2234000 RepID=UPI000FDB6A07|nr:hypothetical protein [Halobacteriovorax sp. HLS]